MKNYMLVVFPFILLSSFYKSVFADDSLQEFQIKRKEVYEFTKEPILTKLGDKITIEFSVKDYCDVTIAIQNQNGDILRHLASGVLGSKAPEPLQSNSLSQKIEWDSKDDRGIYLDNLSSISIRVSLGLKPMYEKDLYTSPYKRISEMPCIATAKEGLYVYEGFGRDQIRLFGHNGEYIKTVYPFPASKIEAVKGIAWGQFASRSKIPVKLNTYHQTFLSSGDNKDAEAGGFSGMLGRGATVLNVQNDRMAIAMKTVNRLCTDGSTGGFNLNGPKVGYKVNNRDASGGKSLSDIGPSSLAFSPDGKIVYLTGFMWNLFYVGVPGNIPVVMKMNYESDEAVTVFAGKNKEEEFGAGDDKLNTPTSVDTDSKGNVYVSDYWNDRVQIFNPEGKVIGSIKTSKPAKVLIHKLTDEIFVFTYGVIGVPPSIQREVNYEIEKVPQKLNSFSAFPNLKPQLNEDFPFGPFFAPNVMFNQGNTYQISLDSWNKNLAFWIVGKKYKFSNVDLVSWGAGKKNSNDWLNDINIKRVERIDGKWVETDNFGNRVKKQIARPKAPTWNVQHLAFNPKSKKLYIGEGDSAPEDQAYNQLIEVNVESGVSKIIELPLNPLEIAFDLDGLVYLRTMNVVSRFNIDTWKEVPFDYGAENEAVGDDGGLGGRSTPVVGSLMLPAFNAVCYHQSGFDVNTKGDILVACHNNNSKSDTRGLDFTSKLKFNSGYEPVLFPGRLVSSTSVCLHVWDKYGKMKLKDIVPGCSKADGVYMDKDNNVYLLATPPRKINGKEIDDGMSSTLFKFKPNKGKFLAGSSTPVPLPEAEIPQRPQEIRNMWAENYEWIYGGVGFGGFNDGNTCACWFVRFKLDYFGRTFAPEPMQYSVSVLDSSGNLITRIGRYGNADSCGPKSKEPLGGDEVGLFHPSFVGVHTDHRLFISDVGNERIVSVKLDYHVNKVLSIAK